MKVKLKPGDMFRIKKGSTDSDGNKFNEWVFKTKHTVAKVVGSDVLFCNEAGVVIGRTNIKNVIVEGDEEDETA